MYVRDGWPRERVTNVLVVVSDEPAGHLTRIPTDHEELEENPLLDRWGTLPPHRPKGGARTHKTGVCDDDGSAFGRGCGSRRL